jgi:hypothetical protein
MTQNIILLEQYAMIANYPNYAVSSYGNVLNIKTGRILRPGIDRNGYYYVNLYKNKAMTPKKNHRLVTITFLDNPDNKKCTDHIDRNRLNNNISNLRYATYSENNQNRSKCKNNTSTCTGVSFHKKANKWEVRITINGTRTHIGLYINFYDAVISRKEQEKIHYKEFQAI